MKTAKEMHAPEIEWSENKGSWRVMPRDVNGNVFLIAYARNRADADTILSLAHGQSHERAVVLELLDALHKIAYEPIGHAEASHREVLDGIVEIAKAAIAAATPK